MGKRQIIFILAVAFILSGCQTPKVGYFEDFENGRSETVLKRTEILIHEEDKISIVVKSKDAKLTELFNLPVMTHRIGYTASESGYSEMMSIYTVDSDGEIDFPVLGSLKVAGMKRAAIAKKIKQLLIDHNLLKDPVVTVEYANLGFDVLGEVNKPGRYSFDRDHLTLLDAISMAGDLTIYGRRDNVTVIRENGDKRDIYKINLKSGKEVLSSPVFYLQQNDVVYVEPNEYRARQTTVNGNELRSTAFWISLASLMTTIAVLIFK